MALGSETVSGFGTLQERDAAFEQLLRLAASCAPPRAAAPERLRAKTKGNPVIREIELRAYEIYLGRGATDGHDLDDWLEAERQVLEKLKKDKASLGLALAFGLLKDSER